MTSDPDTADLLSRPGRSLDPAPCVHGNGADPVSASDFADTNGRPRCRFDGAARVWSSRTRTLNPGEVSDVSKELKIELFEPGADHEALDGLASDLRLELLELDVDSVSPVALEPPPEGSKGMELAAIGALLVHVKDALPVVNAVVTAARQWLARASSSGRSLKITVDGRTLELSAATAEQQQQLVDGFLRSLGAPGQPDTT